MVAPKKKVATHKPGNKPRIVEFRQGDILFKEKDKAQALYIIKEGQIRLFRPKGKGFVEIAVLRKGEVIGEMAYFDEKQSRRSCSASALVNTKVIEIGFPSFGKAIQNLNPWFKTIIFTLADRLRDSNDLVKSLESNSLSYGAIKASEYKFFTYGDLVKLLNYFLIIFKGHGEKCEEGFKLSRNNLKYHILDVFNFPESKMEEFIKIMEGFNCIQVIEDEKKNPNIFILTNENFFIENLKFIDEQRRLEQNKRLVIPPRSEAFMAKILEQFEATEQEPKGTFEVDLVKICEDFKTKKMPVGKEDFLKIVSQGLAQEVVEGKGSVEIDKIMSIFPVIKFNNIIEKINEEKAEKS